MFNLWFTPRTLVINDLFISMRENAGFETQQR
jgi:hypothetical protein